MNFELEQTKRLTKIEEILRSYLPKEEGYYRVVMEAMNYSMTAGGKRIRPMLMLETFHLFEGKDVELVYPFMVAIEMIHTYSLVHDDLPAMDNDQYRRGRKTTHIVYGEAMAILAGDGLLTYAFEIVAGACDRIDEGQGNELALYRRVMRAIKIMATKAGINGMIGGQVIDMESVGQSATKDRLDLMYKLKTSALIEASMMIGAILAGADDKDIDSIENMAGDIGLAFQIRDDILDVISSEKVLGKPVGSDEKNDKSTYVALMDVEQAKSEVTSVTERAKKEYESLPYENEFLEVLITRLMNREK